MHADLEAGFDKAMMQVYLSAKQEAGYPATRYLQMLRQHRGLQTARMLILADHPPEGYTALWERRRLDLTVEAMVLQPRCRPLFAEEPEVLERAKRRLTAYGYEP
jgi:hypothetical protein